MISIILPVYNTADVLRFCVDSILKQSYSNFELIIVDDGSNDNSRKICEEYAGFDTRIRVIHKENGGVSSARNLGIKKATGDYICFVDSDDYIEKNFLQKLAFTCQNNPGYENIWCGFKTVGGYLETTVKNKVIFTNDSFLTKTTYQKIMDLHEKWLDAGPFSKLYSRKRIINNNLFFDESLSLGEDLVFNFQYLNSTNGKILVINDCLYNYVIDSTNSLSKKFYPNMFEIYKKINRVMYSYMNKWGCSKEQFSKYHNACFYKYEVVLRNTFSPQSTILHKYKYNRIIMSSQVFKEAFINSNCFIHPLYRFAYKYKLYVLVRLFDYIQNKKETK